MSLFGCGASASEIDAGTSHLLELVGDVPLPGGATRFDYQDVDVENDHLVIAHMGDDEVLVVSLSDGSAIARVPGVQTVRGIAIGGSPLKIFATAAATDELVIVDAAGLEVTGRVPAGAGPDGGWADTADGIVGVSDQHSGSLALIANDGAGEKVEVELGDETGNVVFDETRAWFWITVVTGSENELVAVAASTHTVQTRIALDGCSGAHGLRLHPDASSAFIACEGNNKLARVALSAPYALTTHAVGNGPDVLALDVGLGRLYVAAESGNLSVFDMNQEGLVLVSEQDVGAHAHSVAVDPSTHRVFFPLMRGAEGTPVLRIMRPTN